MSLSALDTVTIFCNTWTPDGDECPFSVESDEKEIWNKIADHFKDEYNHSLYIVYDSYGNSVKFTMKYVDRPNPNGGFGWSI